MKKKTVWPSKITLNLCVRERSKISPIRVIPLSLVVLLCVGAFSKFAVIDRFAALNVSSGEVTQLQDELGQLRLATADFETVQEQFRRYSYGSFSPTELALVDRMEVLDLLDTTLAPAGKIHSLAVSGDQISLSLEDITLEQSSQLVADLLENPIVSDVAVSSAGYGTANLHGVRPLMASMSITLSHPPEGGEG